LSSKKSLGLIAALAGVCALQPSLALAQKSGGTLRSYEVANPPSASILEEATSGTTHPFMAVFNNLVIFDQAEPVNKPEVIRPELAESWTWDAAQTKLTFKLRQGVTWHDGKPFTAKDVKCTWDALAGKADERVEARHELRHRRHGDAPGGDRADAAADRQPEHDEAEAA